MIHLRLERASQEVIAVITLTLVAAVGVVDYLTGAELSSSVFYALPVAVAAWYGSPRLGGFLCMAAAATWYVADRANGNVYSAAWIPLWNTGVRLLFFALTTALVVRLRLALDSQRELAERDGLTGLANGRRFLAAVSAEVGRSHRYKRPLSLAYVDLDGFKSVNDTSGHAVGDDVLETVGKILAVSVRATDLPARLGGDEFAVLLPESNSEQAKEAAAKLRGFLEGAMSEAGWSVGFSMGVYTSQGGIQEADELVRLADDLMYEVKHSGKGRTLFRAEGEFTAPQPASIAGPESRS